MQNIQLFATPWWVNLAILVPIGTYIWLRRGGNSISWPKLIYAALFAIGFGINEAVVVVYLRASMALQPGFDSTLGSAPLTPYQQTQLLHTLPQSVMQTEMYREAATMVMLLGVAFLVAKHIKERWAFFLWMFAFWDITYYVGLWMFTRWPESLLTQDVLFLIPVPWISQVWFPVLVCVLGIGSVVGSRRFQ
jgi:hypothetical protein